MPTQQLAFISISCDGVIEGKACDKNVMFAATQEAQQAALRDTPWLVELRTIQSASGQKFTYCSDTCEASGIARSKHGAPSKIIQTANQAQVDVAARAQALAQQAQAAIKQGQGIEVIPG